MQHLLLTAIYYVLILCVACIYNYYTESHLAVTTNGSPIAHREPSHPPMVLPTFVQFQQSAPACPGPRHVSAAYGDRRRPASVDAS